ncbi:MAG: flavin reductase family protein [Acidimicrobiales bacterium]
MSDHGLPSSEFRRVLGHFATGVTVVTAEGPGGPAGMTVGSFASVSLDPPLVTWCPSRTASAWEAIRSAGSFCVNVLGEHQMAACETFAGSSDDRFAGLAARTEATGAPVIEGSIAWIDCDTHAIHDGGDHEIVVGLVRALGAGGPEGPLIFYRGGFGRFAEL